MIADRRFFLKLLGGLFASALAPTVGWAGGKRRGATTPTPTPEPTAPAADPATPKSTGARLRLWKASDTPDRPLQIRFRFPGKPDSDTISPLQIESEGYQFSKYVDVPSGSMIAEITASERPTVLLPLQLVDGGQSTLLVRAQGTSLTAEWIDDTPEALDNGNEFKIYNLLPASGDIQVDLGSILTAHLSSAHSSLRMNGIKRAAYPVTINGFDGSGKNFRWNTEADFRQYRKAALLIYPDAYGRIRPRINAL